MSISKMSKSERTKQTIIDSAMTLFSSKGYEATSVDELVAKSGIAKGTYYYHFKQKEDVLMYIVKSDFDKYFDMSEKMAYDDGINGQTKFEGIMASLFRNPEDSAHIETYFEQGIPTHYVTAIDKIRFDRLVPPMMVG